MKDSKKSEKEVKKSGKDVEQSEKNIRVVILDRPNPAGGLLVEGNVLKEKFKSFVGMLPIPQRHGMTFGEVAKWINEYHHPCDLHVVPIKGWTRSLFFTELSNEWVLPSPNLATAESSLVYPGTVLFEGTNISEGRGTTRALEMVGHPKVSPFALVKDIEKDMKNWNIKGAIVRPTMFRPTFQKFQNQTCGGFQIHVTDPSAFLSWRMGQLLCLRLFHTLQDSFSWSREPYEYEMSGFAIDYINGTDEVRKWVEKEGTLEELVGIENENREEFLKKREEILIYRD